MTLNKPELVDLLINYNADLYEANKKGLRPLDVPTSNASIKAKLQSHHERVQEAKEAQTAEHDKLQVFMKSPSRLSSAGSVDVLASSPGFGAGTPASGSCVPLMVSSPGLLTEGADSLHAPTAMSRAVTVRSTTFVRTLIAPSSCPSCRAVYAVRMG